MTVKFVIVAHVFTLKTLIGFSLTISGEMIPSSMRSIKHYESELMEENGRNQPCDGNIIKALRKDLKMAP